MRFTYLFLWLGLMVRCAYMPWKSWIMFQVYEKHKTNQSSKYIVLAGSFLFYATGLVRNNVLEGRPLIPLLIKMSVVIFSVMLASFKASMVVAGVSSGVDLCFIFLFIFGLKINAWMTGVWEIGALIIAFFSIYRMNKTKIS